MAEIILRTIVLLDLYLSSFITLYGVEPKLEFRNGKVVFVFEADDRVYKLMNLFNGNVEVPVADFVTTEGITGNGNGVRNGYGKGL